MRRGPGGLLRIGLLAVGLVLMGTSAALSDPAAVLSSQRSMESDDATHVSTSPAVAEIENGRFVRDDAAGKQRLRPLTRAAAQTRLASVSPLGWLSRFGNVEIELRDE